MDNLEETISIINTKKAINSNINLYNYLKSKYPRMKISLKYYVGYYTYFKKVDINYNYIELIYNSRIYHISYYAYICLENNKGLFFSINELAVERENVYKLNISSTDLGNNQKFTSIIFKFIKQENENQCYEQMTLF